MIPRRGVLRVLRQFGTDLKCKSTKAGARLTRKEKANRKRVVSKFRADIKQLYEEANLDQAIDLLGDLDTAGTKPDVGLMNFVLSLAQKSSSHDLAMQVFMKMKASGLKLQESTWCIMMSCAMNEADGSGRGDAERVSDAMSYLEGMISSGIPPRFRCYSTLVDHFSSTYDVPSLVNLWSHMKRNHVKVPSSFYMRLIEVCHHSKGSLKGYGSLVNALLHQLAYTTVRFNEDQGEALRGLQHMHVASISHDGVCSCCGGTLGTKPISSRERDIIKQGVIQEASAAGQDHLGVSNAEMLEEFDAYMARRKKPPTMIFDAANIGWHNKEVSDGVYRFDQVEKIYQQCLELGYEVLLIIPARYSQGQYIPSVNKKHRQHRSGKDASIIRKWRRDGVLYECNHGTDDDWYWIYASVARDDAMPLVITNDKMRDHKEPLIVNRHQQPFKSWYYSQVVSLKNEGYDGLFLEPPRRYSPVIQQAGDTKKWHIPVVKLVNTGPYDEERICALTDICYWLCVDLECSEELTFGSPRLDQHLVDGMNEADKTEALEQEGLGR